MNIIQRIEWKIYKNFKILRLQNKTPSIISSNCIGTYIYHDMKLKFNSPTINLSFEMNDFVRFLENLSWYLEQEITPYDDKRFDFPCGMIGDIEIRFNHYSSIDEAIKKWNERKKRIDWNNMFIFGIDGDDCTYESIKKFDSLPFENKIIFTHKKYPEFSSSFYLYGFENLNCVLQPTELKKQFFIRRHIDQFDYITFLNKKKRKRNE